MELSRGPSAFVPSFYSIVAVVLVAVLYVCYRTALPRPIAGIPHNVKSARRVLGDMPELLKWRKTGNALGYFPSLARQTESPIFQIFMRPWGQPWVFVTDARECHDIMTRRYAEFDRSKFLGDMFKPVVPRFHLHFPTNREWTVHRRILGDTMSASFLNDVAGKQMWKVMQNVVKLWRVKARLANGRPFEGSEDVKRAAMDIVWAATFGYETGIITTQLDYLNAMDRDKAQLSTPTSDPNMEVKFPSAREPTACTSLWTVLKVVRIGLRSPFPRIHQQLVLNYVPHVVRAVKHKNQMIKTALLAAQRKFSSQKVEDMVETTTGLTSAVDLVVAKEIKMAEKERREPEVDNEVLQDELFGFMIGGLETSSTNICWGLKFLIQHQEAQGILRAALESTFSSLDLEGLDGSRSNPTIEDITQSNIPYLEAVIAEILRCSMGAFANTRVAKVDTQILGYHIPKGTDIFLLNNGPGKLMEPLKKEVPEFLRSQSSQEAKDRTREWDTADIGSFKPERWLVKDEDGNGKYDPLAGPSHPFGAGPRGCFGLKWALLEMKIFLVLTIWNFKLLPTPEVLSSWAVGEQTTPVQTYFRLQQL